MVWRIPVFMILGVSLFYTTLEIEEMKLRISKFRENARKGMRDKDCIDYIISIFGNGYAFPVEYREYKKGNMFFRARRMPRDDRLFPLRTIRQIQDAWEVPPNCVTPGRLNGENQSVLYCCPGDPQLAIDEARAQNDELAAIIVYRSRCAVKVAVLGDYENSDLPKDNLTRFFYEFLDEEFSRVVPAGNEGMYAITRAIADSFFSYPEQHAWCYRSVQSPRKFNVAFLPGRHRDCLDLVGVMICDIRESTEGRLRVKTVVDFDEATGKARYHGVGSPEQRRLFPNIR